MGNLRCGLGRPARQRTGLTDRTPATAASLAAFLLATTLFSSLPATERPAREPPAGAAARPAHDQPLYKNPNAPVEQRVEDLLARMTLEEKIAQITCIWNRKQEILTPAGDFDAARAKQVFPAGIGQVARPKIGRASCRERV